MIEETQKLQVKKNSTPKKKTNQKKQVNRLRVHLMQKLIRISQQQVVKLIISKKL